MIEGDRVRLRPIREDDLERMVTWRNQARRSFIDDRPLGLEGQQTWFARYLASGERCYIIETETAEPVGMICLYAIDTERRSAEFGRLVVDERCAGQGFGTDASRALLRYASGELRLRHVRLEVLAGNERARALYERVGFSRDASLDRVAERPNGERVELLGMSLKLEGER